MPKRGKSVLFFPRQKEGEDTEPGKLTRHIRVNYEALEGLFHLKLKDAAREIGLCPTTFKKACRNFNLSKWPSRKGQRVAAMARWNVQTDGADAATRTLHQEPICAPTLQTTEMHHAKRAVTVSCTSPVWHEESDAWRRDTSASCFAFPFNDSYSSTASPELHAGWPDPFVAALSSAAPEGLLHQTSAALDTRSCGEARYAGAAFQRKALAPPYIDSLGASICIGVPMPESHPATGPGGGELPWREAGAPNHLDGKGGAEAGPPREKSCGEAVMEYLALGCAISEADVESMLADDD